MLMTAPQYQTVTYMSEYAVNEPIYSILLFPQFFKIILSLITYWISHSCETNIKIPAWIRNYIRIKLSRVLINKQFS